MDSNQNKPTFLFESILVVAALAATPLIFFPECRDQFNLPKMVWVRSLAIVWGLWALWRTASGRSLHLPLHAVNVLILLFLVWNLAMWPWATSSSLAADKVAWMAAAALFCWAWQEWGGKGRRQRLLAACWCLALSAGATSVWALYQDVQSQWGEFFPSWLPRFRVAENLLGDWRGVITAGFGNPDFVALFHAILYIPILFLMLFVRGRVRIFVLLGILWLMAATMIVCWSVGGNGALILASLIVLIGLGSERRQWVWRRRRKRLAIWLTGCAAVILLFVTNTPLNPHRPGIFQEAFGSERWHEGAPTRGVIWLNTLEIVRAYPWLGAGPGCFDFAYPSMLSALVPDDFEWQRYQGAYTNAAHNSLLQTWAELGPVGVFLLIAMVGAAFLALGRTARRSEDERALNGWIAWGGIGALAALCLDSMMTFPLQLPASVILFFALLPLGNMIFDPGAGAKGDFRMPPLTLDGRWTEITVHFRDMKRPTGLSIGFKLPNMGRVLFLVFLIVVGGFACWRGTKLIVAERLFTQGRAMLQTLKIVEANDSQRERVTDLRGGLEQYYQRTGSYFQSALDWNPNHHNCRSLYSEMLLRSGRFQECIDQIGIVFKRHDVRELYLRRAQAYQALGMKEEALRDQAIYTSRVPPLLR